MNCAHTTYTYLFKANERKDVDFGDTYEEVCLKREKKRQEERDRKLKRVSKQQTTCICSYTDVMYISFCI